MRVLVGPGLETDGVGPALVLAHSLAGPEGEVVLLREYGVGSLSRALTAAEVQSIREALLGYPLAGDDPVGQSRGSVVGYVCAGRAVRGSAENTAVAVTDHADLTWRSPLAGPNDDRLGPRFPRVDGVYAADMVMERAAVGSGVTIIPAAVAGITKDAGEAGWEWGVIEALGLYAVSSELIAVAIIAAHLGLRLGAAMIL